jgi:hypothetical protein
MISRVGSQPTVSDALGLDERYAEVPFLPPLPEREEAPESCYNSR